MILKEMIKKMIAYEDQIESDCYGVSDIHNMQVMSHRIAKHKRSQYAEDIYNKEREKRKIK